MEPSALRGWTRGKSVSIEREVFPSLIGSGEAVFGFSSDAYWLDLGTPEMYLQAHFDLFEKKVHGVSYPAPWVGSGAEVDLRAHLGRWVAVGSGARIGPEAQVDDSVLHPGAIVEEGARVVRSIVGAGARIGQGATLSESVLGEGSSVPAGQTLEGGRVPSFTVAWVAD